MQSDLDIGRTGRLGVCFLLGALLGTLLDGIHVYGNVLSYPHEAFGRWAWFVPLEFGLLGLGAGLAMPLLEPWLSGGDLPGWSVTRRFGEVVFFALLYLSTVLVDGNGAAPALLAAALTLLVVVRLAIERCPGDWFYALTAALAGPIVEASMIGAGLFDYAHPDLVGIPIWLAPLWANGGLMIRRVLAPIALKTAAVESII